MGVKIFDAEQKEEAMLQKAYFREMEENAVKSVIRVPSDDKHGVDFANRPTIFFLGVSQRTCLLREIFEFSRCQTMLEETSKNKIQSFEKIEDPLLLGILFPLKFMVKFFSPFSSFLFYESIHLKKTVGHGGTSLLHKYGRSFFQKFGYVQFYF